MYAQKGVDIQACENTVRFPWKHFSRAVRPNETNKYADWSVRSRTTPSIP